MPFAAHPSLSTAALAGRLGRCGRKGARAPLLNADLTQIDGPSEYASVQPGHERVFIVSVRGNMNPVTHDVLYGVYRAIGRALGRGIRGITSRHAGHARISECQHLGTEMRSAARPLESTHMSGTQSAGLRNLLRKAGLARPRSMTIERCRRWLLEWRARPRLG